MKNLITDFKTLLIAILGLTAGFIWAFNSKWDTEPIWLISVSSIEIICFILLKRSSPTQESKISIKTKNTGTFNLSIHDGQPSLQESDLKATDKSPGALDRETIIDLMKQRSKVLFIDDDKNFNVVKILKESGWRHTKNTPDIKNIDIPMVKESHILFVDINGVGKLLNLTHEGLDLSLMIKERYPEKKVIIYSASRTSNSFHKAWDVCDFKLEKNALPNQFQNLVEKYSLELYNATI